MVDGTGKSSHGGYCGPAVKAHRTEYLIQQVNSDYVDGPPIPMSGIGGIGSVARYAAEFILLTGCGTVQVYAQQRCTTAIRN